MNHPLSFGALIVGIAIGATMGHLHLSKIKGFGNTMGVASGKPAERGAEDLTALTLNTLSANSDSGSVSDSAGLEQSLSGMDEVAALTQIDGLPLSNELSHLQDRKVDEFLSGQPSAESVLSLRSILPMAKYHTLLARFVSRLDFSNFESASGSLRIITGGLLDPKEKAAFLKGIGEGLSTANTPEALRFAGVVEDATLGLDIIKEFIRQKEISQEDIEALLTTSGSQSEQTQKAVAQAISQRLMEKSPIEALKLASSSADPDVLENLISESVNFQNMADPAVSAILDTSPPGVRNTLAEKMSKQILNTLDDKEKLLNLLSMPYPESIRSSVLSKVGYSLSLVMPGTSFDKFLLKINDNNVRQQLQLQIR